MLLRYLFLSFSVGNVYSCVGVGLCGYVSMIRIFLMGGCSCSLGSCVWVTSGCSVICFLVTFILFLPGGSTLTMGGGDFIGVASCCGICCAIWGCWAALSVGINFIVGYFDVCIGIY